MGQLAEGGDDSFKVLRRSTRIPYYKKLKYGLLSSRGDSDPENLRFTGFTFNLSEHGVGLEGNKGFPPNFKIRASLYTGEKTLTFEGIIKWLYHSNSEKWYMGIEITSRMDDIRGIYAILSETESG